MLISVVGPMRGRPDGAIRAINSFVNQADDPDNIEFIVFLSMAPASSEL